MVEKEIIFEKILIQKKGRCDEEEKVFNGDCCCVFSGAVPGFSRKWLRLIFIGDEAQDALNRINAIRLEAKNEGILALKGNNDGQLADSRTASGEALRWS